MEYLRAFGTVAVMAAFFAIVWWAYAPSRRSLWQQRAELDDE
jgi:cbb3-type cytochrome oxidase subunit 3